LTSLDTATRLARFALQEFFSKTGLKAEEQSLLSRNRYIATIIGVAFAGLLVISGQGLKIWPFFGAANQLLAALALVSVTVWLSRKGRKTGLLKYRW
jgi:carbon starvation protein